MLVLTQHVDKDIHIYSGGRYIGSVVLLSVRNKKCVRMGFKLHDDVDVFSEHVMRTIRESMDLQPHEQPEMLRRSK